MAGGEAFIKKKKKQWEKEGNKASCLLLDESSA